jgi:hypothetical protein
MTHSITLELKEVFYKRLQDESYAVGLTIELVAVAWMVAGSVVFKSPTPLVTVQRAVQPNWEDAPEWAEWYAVDSTGSGFWYPDEPVLDVEAGVWENDHPFIALDESSVEQPTPEWQTMKWQRSTIEGGSDGRGS